MSSFSTKRNWFSFSLRTLLGLMTLACIGIVAKQQYDWYWKTHALNVWLQPLLEAAAAADGDPAKFVEPPTALVRPSNVGDEDVIPLLSYGILHSKLPVERMAALRVLVRENSNLPTLRQLLSETHNAEIRHAIIHMIGLEREPADIPLLTALLDHRDSETRAAAIDALGCLRTPHYLDPFLEVSLNTLPPVFAAEGIQGQLSSFPPTWKDEEQTELRNSLERFMLAGQTANERMAAARALITWPPQSYELRVAEWGVWIDEGGQLTLAKEVLDENPPFVHRTGNSVETLRGNRGQSMFVTKPVIHLTSNCEMSVDLDVAITHGRPWFAYPKPDGFVVCSGIDADLALEQAPKFAINATNTLDSLEGYTWIHPQHRSGLFAYAVGTHSMVGPVDSESISPPPGIGLRWQSLIV